jgi:RNA polymerase sigma-70 factor, ECF subfamily
MPRNCHRAFACSGRPVENGTNAANRDRRPPPDAASIGPAPLDAGPLDAGVIDGAVIDAGVIGAAPGDSIPRDANPSAAATERFLKLFLENERHLYAFIVCILPSLADADDILQETSLILWKKIHEFQMGTDFLAWACRIAQFRVLQFYEKQGRSRVRFDAQALEAVAAEAIDQGPLQEARHQALARCLESLKQRDRDLLQRRYSDGSSPRQIAVQVGRSIDAVYKALSRIHDSLMQCIQQKLAKE